MGFELRGENGKPIIAGYPLPHRRLRPGVRTVCAIFPLRDMYITIDNFNIIIDQSGACVPFPASLPPWSKSSRGKSWQIEIYRQSLTSPSPQLWGNSHSKQKVYFTLACQFQRCFTRQVLLHFTCLRPVLFHLPLTKYFCVWLACFFVWGKFYSKYFVFGLFVVSGQTRTYCCFLLPFIDKLVRALFKFFCQFCLIIQFF